MKTQVKVQIVVGICLNLSSAYLQDCYLSKRGSCWNLGFVEFINTTEQCQRVCQATENCEAFSYHPLRENKRCNLCNNKDLDYTGDDCKDGIQCIFGPVVCPNTDLTREYTFSTFDEQDTCKTINALIKKGNSQGCNICLKFEGTEKCLTTCTKCGKPNSAPLVGTVSTNEYITAANSTSSPTIELADTKGFFTLPKFPRSEFKLTCKKIEKWIKTERPKGCWTCVKAEGSEKCPKTCRKYCKATNKEPNISLLPNLLPLLSSIPSITPSFSPTVEQSPFPSREPSFILSHFPSSEPSVIPSSSPIREPSFAPSNLPSSFECIDYPGKILNIGRGKKIKCENLSNKNKARIKNICRKKEDARIFCAITCGTCPSDSPLSTPSLSPASSSIPSNLPIIKSSFNPSREPSFIPSSILPTNALPTTSVCLKHLPYVYCLQLCNLDCKDKAKCHYCCVNDNL